MGINKPNVRYVVHYDLPKNIEGYYQETGRAGRDGLPSECLLFFSAGDAVKQRRFIDEKTDPEEQRVARAQLQQMLHYAESSGCRRAALLEYFGEKTAEEGCGSCDNCLQPRQTYDGTIPAQKFLSCVYRIRQGGGFSVGLAHVVEVLTGAQSEKVKKWGHDRLSTYGIGKDVSRPHWQEIGRELLRSGLVRQSEGKFAVLEITPEGMAALKERKPIALTQPLAQAKPKSEKRDRGAITCDEMLFNRLRVLRKELADARDIPAYVVFSDVTLRLMARDQPTDLDAMSRISGVGQKKLAEFGGAFTAAIRDYLAES